jgi:hypothetical protein
MTEQPEQLTIEAPEERGPLSWESLGAQPAGRAFRRSLAELLARPRRFFRRMALNGGLHEPLTFFALMLAAAVVLSFPAALSYFGVAAPDPDQVSPDVYRAYALPARWSGMLLVLLPLVLVGAGVAMVLLGTLFHAGSKPFGTGNWEGSVSVWLYAGAAALAPTVLAVAVFFGVSLAGYLLGLALPAAGDAAGAFVRWTFLILCPAALLAAAALLVVGTTVGCTQAFGLDPLLGAAAAVSGLLVVAAAVALSTWSFVRWGGPVGLVVAGGWALLSVAVATGALMVSRPAEGGA